MLDTLQRLFDTHAAPSPLHGALFLAFCIWNVAHHMIYVYSRVPLSRTKLLFNATGDLLGNGWRHFVMVAFVPASPFAGSLDALLWLNAFHASTHVFGIAWAGLHPQTMLPYVSDFQRRALPRWQLALNWLIEQNDMAFYALAGVLVGAELHPLLTMLVVMIAAPMWLPKAPSPAHGPQ